jgi:hypothetical protein
MKHSLTLLSAGVLFAGVAVAQDASAPRTPSYNAVTQGNIAVDYTTADYLVRPHLINQGFIAGYGLTGGAGAGTGNAALAFNAIGLNWLGAMDNTPTVLNIRAGIGMEKVFGAGILYELNKRSTSTEGGLAEINTDTVLPGDGFGLFGSFNLMDMFSLFGELTFATGYGGPYIKVENTTANTTTESDNSTTQIVLGMKKDASGEGTHAFRAIATMTFGSVTSSSEDATGTTKIEDQSTFGLNVVGAYGTPVKKNDDYSVFLGSDLTIGFSSFKDEVAPSTPEESSLILIGITPNLAFQKTLGKGFETQCGASVPAFIWAKSKAKTGTVEDGYSVLTSVGTNVDLGLRWTLGNFAFEGVISNNFLQNGPAIIGGNPTVPGMFGNIGVSLGF